MRVRKSFIYIPTQVIHIPSQIVTLAPAARTNVLWKIGMEPSKQTETVSVGDEIMFIWSGEHNVYKLPNRTAFHDCEFSEAVELASDSQNNFLYQATDVGTFFFSCELPGRCEMGQTLELTVITGRLCWVNARLGAVVFCE